MTLLVVIWYGRFLEGLVNGLRQQLAERTEIEVTLRSDVQVWQAYVISLQKRMIEAGIRVPEAPQPVQVRRKGRRVEITTAPERGHP